MEFELSQLRVFQHCWRDDHLSHLEFLGFEPSVSHHHKRFMPLSLYHRALCVSLILKGSDYFCLNTRGVISLIGSRCICQCLSWLYKPRFCPKWTGSILFSKNQEWVTWPIFWGQRLGSLVERESEGLAQVSESEDETPEDRANLSSQLFLLLGVFP